MKRLLIAILLLTGISRAEACYTPKEVEAEQGVRIHSELMVIGLTCLKMPQGSALYSKYQQFTQKNSSLIAGYEASLIDHYVQAGISEPEKRFHALRTGFANEISQRAISMSMLSFCQQYSSHIDKALMMDEQKVRRWAQHVRPDQPPSEPVCKG